MGKPSAPKPPDPRETAAAQTGASVSTAIANAYLGNVNRRTPDGTVTYNRSGSRKITDPTTGETFDIPRFTETVRLSEAGRKLQKRNDRTQLNLASLAQNQSRHLSRHLDDPMNLRGIEGIERTSIDDLPEFDRSDFGGLPEIESGMAARDRAEAALMERMQPHIDRDRENLETSLANRGLGIASDAYGVAQDNFGRQVNDARLGAIINAGAEQDRIFGQSLAARRQGVDEQARAFDESARVRGTRFAEQQRRFDESLTARQQGVSERKMLRDQPINEITALLSGSQVSAPAASGGRMPSIPTTDYAGLVNANYNAQMQGYQNQLASRNAMMGGLFDITSAGVSAYPF